MPKSSETEFDKINGADVTRQAELVAMEYLKSWKCTQTLDQVMAKSKIKSSSLLASELYTTDLDNKKKAPREYKSVLEYMVSSLSRTSSESRASDSEGSHSSRSSRRRSSVSSDTSQNGGEVSWSKEDISKLKKAIKETTCVEDKNDRWREIALLVGNGKSKKHCYIKYKELKEEKKSSSSSRSSPSSSSRRSSEDKSGKQAKSGEGEPGKDKSLLKEKNNVFWVKEKPVREAASRRSTSDEVASLQSVLFSDGKKAFSSHWEEQGLFYTDVPNLRYGLVQHEGGPCGVLAVVQAYVLRFLLEQAPRNWQNPDRAEQSKALASALTFILHQAAGGSRTECLVILNERSTASKAPTKRKFMAGVVIHASPNEADTRALLMDHLDELTERKGNGLVLFVLSVLLSKGVAKIKSEMDQVEGVQQRLQREATTGRHERRRPKAVVLKGVPARAAVGFLSLFEAYEYMVVGSHLKCPKFNIWVVCSESHYSVLFTEPTHIETAHLDEVRALDLYYYDGLASQDEVIRLSVDALALEEKLVAKHDDLIPPLNLVIQTKWPLATINWHDVEPLL
uniref:Myb-like domain-containing protein n=1 Tax=Globisporangium ultimum (strain ATCC 200006 / CBS 805.95 / DAOM BR144) TaxID=431595 RepID=K3X280_GLOUD